MSQENEREPKNGHRRSSSILKVQNGAENIAASQQDTTTVTKRVSRRVSFAETKVVKEYDKDGVGVGRSPRQEPDLLGDILQQKPKEGEAIECCVIVDGVPIIGQEKLPKLRYVLDKLFEKLGKVNSSHYPLDENEQTKGCVFVEFAWKTSAERALEVFNGYRLDKSHTFKVNSFADLDKFKKPAAKWTAPQKEPYKDLEVKRKLKLDTSYAQQFEIEDQRDKGKASKDVLDKRQKQKREFEEWRRNKDKFIEEDRNERIKLRGGFDTEAENQGVELEEETIELPLTHEETIIETGEEE